MLQQGLLIATVYSKNIAGDMVMVLASNDAEPTPNFHIGNPVNTEFTPGTVSALDIKLLKILRKRPLKNTTELFVSAEKCASVSKVIITIGRIKETLKNLKIGLFLKNNVIQEINKRFRKIKYNHILAISTILDPRFKNIHFSDTLVIQKLSYIPEEITKPQVFQKLKNQLTKWAKMDSSDLWAQTVCSRKNKTTP